MKKWELQRHRWRWDRQLLWLQHRLKIHSLSSSIIIGGSGRKTENGGVDVLLRHEHLLSCSSSPLFPPLIPHLLPTTTKLLLKHTDKCFLLASSLSMYSAFLSFALSLSPAHCRTSPPPLWFLSGSCTTHTLYAPSFILSLICKTLLYL